MLVDLRVVNRGGQFVAGLTRDDFRIYEDGKEQVITNFSFVNLPTAALLDRGTTRARARVSSDVASNGADEGRLYLIVLDTTHALRTPAVRALAREFVERHLTDADQAAVVPMSGRRNMIQEFTHNPKTLLDAIDGFRGDFGVGSGTVEPGRGADTLPSMQRNALGDLVGAGDLVESVDAGPGQSELSADSAVRTLDSLVTWLSQIQGRRKAIVFISEDVRRIIDPPPPQPGNIPDVRQGVPELLSGAARANVSFYIVDPTGVPGDLRTDKTAGIRPPLLVDGVPGDPDQKGLSLGGDEDRRQALRVLAEDTGGLAFGITSNDFGAAFDRIVEENSSYYLLAYTPADTQRDGKFHKIKIDIKRPNLRVRSRSGYRAENASKKPAPAFDGLRTELVDLLKSPISMSGLTLSVTAVAYRGQKSAASVAVVVEARAADLQFSNQDTRFNGAMDIAIVATDEAGKLQGGERGSLTMRLSSGTYDTVAAQGVRLLSSLELLPGRYHLKVAATDSGGGQTRGIVQYDVTVPDFRKSPLAMSGIVLASVKAGKTPTNGQAGRWQKPLGMAPTTIREFTADDELRAFAEIYDSVGPTDGRVNITTTVRNSSGRTTFSRNQALSGETWQPTQQFVTAIPLKNMTPGDYVLAVEARNLAIPDQPAIREIPFSIR